MHIFVSAGEPSGDIHGANLIHELRKKHPHARITGFGGELMKAAGQEQLYPLTQLAVMWFGKVLAKLPTFIRLLKQAKRSFETDKPDMVVVIDYPGFHWLLAKRAYAAGVPVYYFVPPQLWAWAGWRVKKVRKWFNTVLTALPFEDDWYKARQITTRYIGHPYFDEIAEQKPDQEFINTERLQPGPIVALLPGSRDQEVSGNLANLLHAAKQVRIQTPNVRFLVAAFNATQAEVVRNFATIIGLNVEIHVGRTPGIIALATACISVSGSVGLELLNRAVPTVVIYHVNAFPLWLSGFFRKCPYISLVNLLAKEELYPEFLSSKDVSQPVAAHITGWLAHESTRLALVEKLRQLKTEVAIPGATVRAADFLRAEYASLCESSRKLAA